MNFKRIVTLSLIALFFLALSCGRDKNKLLLQQMMITGSVDLSAVENVSGPAFVMVTNTDNIDLIENFAMDTVLGVTTIAPDGSFAFNLAQLKTFPGQPVYIMAFVDNDYTGGVPQPTPGDWLGIYFNPNTWQTAYTIGGDNAELRIRINRRIYDYTAYVSGTVLEEEPGDLTVIAYAGQIDSMDMNAIDFDNIIGYQRINKGEGPVSYSLSILPYGKNVPVENVFIIAMLDKNRNGKPDAGDKIGFYVQGDDGLPSVVTINEGSLSGIDISTGMILPEPSGYSISVTGNFTPPAGYDSESKPVFIMIAKTDDPGALFSDPLNAVKGFARLTPGTNSFDIDLSYTDLEPGDKVMVLALWDKDYAGGFPNPTPGDKVGYYENTDVNNFEFLVTLAEGANSVTPHDTWTFSINKIMYDYDTSIQYTIDPAGRPSGMDESHNLISVAVFRDGVNDGGFPPDYQITDIDYVIGMSTLQYHSDSSYTYTMNVFPALDERITSTANMEIYIYVLYDRDNNGRPSSGDDIAAYWRWYTFLHIIRVPKIWNLTSDMVNVLVEPDGDSGNPYAVRFLGQTY